VSRPLPWYDDTGGPDNGAPVLVLLHAFPLSSVMWDRLVPELTGLGVRVVRVDLPGLGRSDTPPAEAGEPSVATMADAVVGVLDERGVDRASVFGLSTGGYVALALARDHPDRLETLVLGSTTCWVTRPDLPAERTALAEELEATHSLASVLPDHDQGLGPTAHAEQPELVEVTRSIVEAADPLGVAWAARAIAGRPDTSDVLETHPGRVLLVWGEEDTDTPPVVGEALRDLRPPDDRTLLVVVPRTGHLTGLEQPATVAGHLVAYLLPGSPGRMS